MMKSPDVGMMMTRINWKTQIGTIIVLQ